MAYSTLVTATPTSAAANQTIPYLINFQGRLTDNNGNVESDGSYNIKFRLYTVATGGSSVWEEDHIYASSTDNRVSIQDGLFDIQLGTITAISPSLFNEYTEGNLYLEVELPTPATANCNTNGCQSWTEGAMTPRQPLSSSPYAFNSQDLDGLDSSAFGQITAANIWTGTNQFTPTSGVALTVEPAASTNGLVVDNSSGSPQAYFDSNGVLNIAQTIQDTTTTVDLGTSANPFRTGYFGTSVQTPQIDAATSGGTLQTDAGTIQSISSTGLTIDLKNASNTTLTVTNSGGGVAGISVEGGITIGTSQTYNVGSSTGEGTTCTGSQVLSGVVVTGGVVTGGTCVAAGGGQQYLGEWTSMQATTTTNTQTTVQFTGAANSSPSFNNATHVLTLASNSSNIVVETKGGGGGGGAVDDASSAIKGAGGGGEGAYSKVSVVSSLASNYYFMVGAGGAGGASSTSVVSNPGQAGSSSCFGTNSVNACTTPLAEAVGGNGGAGTHTAASSAGGAGGAAASGVGDVTISGAAGIAGTSVANSANSGAGGGQGGGLAISGTSAAGNPGISGGGGSGALTDPAAVTDNAGGNGGAGYVTIADYVTTAGSGNPATLQTAYNNTTGSPDITLGSTGLTVADNSTPVSGDLLDVQNNAQTVNYLAVNSSGISTNGTVTANQISQNYSSASASNGQTLAFTNTNTSGSVAIQGINITPTNSAAGTNTLNLLNFAAGTGGTGTDTTNGISFASSTGYTNFLNTPTTDIDSSGDITSGFINLGPSTTANGTGTNSTTLVLTTATGFVIGNYVQMNSANCGGTGVNPCYAKITNIATNTLTITPAISWTNGSTVNQYHLPEIGGIDTSQALANRFGRGYFIAGVATGNGTTYYDEDSVSTSLSTFNLLDDATLGTLNIGTGATAITIGQASSTVSLPGSLTVAGQSVVNSSGQINGAQLQTGSVANTALASSSLTVSAGTGLTGGGSVALGGTTTLSVNQTAALTWTGAEAFNDSGGVGAQFNGTAASGSAQLLFGSVTALNGGSTSGTYIGANPASYAGDFVNFAINSANKFKVDNSGNLTVAGTITAPTVNASTTLEIGGTPISSSNLSDSSSITKQGNSFNGASQLVQLNGSIQLPAVSGANLTNLNPTNLTTGTGAIAIQPAAAANIGLTTTTSGAINLTTATGNITLSTNGSSAGVTIDPLTNSTTALQVENATGVPVFLVDTATSQSGNYLTYGGFEVGTTTPTGWSAIGSPTTFSRNTTAPNHYGGVASLQLVTTATVANQGGTTSSFNSAPASGSYNVSFYALQTAGTALASSTLQAVINGTATSCNAGVTLNTNGFQRVFCPVTASATITTLGIQVPSASAAVRTLYIDAVQLVSGGSATPATSGAIQLRGAVDSPVVFQALSNSTTAFQIQNTAGTSNLFVADTLDGRIGIGTATPTQALQVVGTVAATGFSGSGTSLTGLDPTQLTQGSGAVTLEGASASNILVEAAGTGTLTLESGSGNQVSLGTSTSLTANGALTVESTGSNALTLATQTSGQNVDLSPNGTGTVVIGGTTPTVTSASTVALAAGGSANSVSITPTTTGTVIIGGTTPTLSSAGSITLQAGGTAQNVLLTPSTSGVVVVGGTAPEIETSGATALKVDTGGGAALDLGPTNATSIVLGGNTAATITNKVANTSTTAYILQTAGGTNLLVVDSTDSRLYVGGSAGSTTPILLVLGNKNSTGDPTGVAGSEYYNSTNNVFRCAQGGTTFVDCINPSNESTASQSPAAASTTYLTGSNLSIPGAGLHAGTQFVWRLAATKTAFGTVANSFLVKYGTLGTTSDATALTFTGPLNTAAVDTGTFTIMVTVQTVNASTGTWEGNLQIVHDDAECVGMVSIATCSATNAPDGYSVNAASGSFNDTTGTIVGLAFTSGTAEAYTFQLIQANAYNL